MQRACAICIHFRYFPLDFRFGTCIREGGKTVVKANHCCPYFSCILPPALGQRPDYDQATMRLHEKGTRAATAEREWCSLCENVS